jgi:pimeloyl-ACP methyl ester carboxylesterase
MDKTHLLSGQTIIFMPGMDGTGISFEPFGEILPQDVSVKIIRYPTDRLLNFEETVQYVKEQMNPDQENAIVLAESFSGPVAVALLGSGQIRAKCLILCATFARSPRPGLLKMIRHFSLELLLGLPFPRFLFKHVVEGGEESADLFISMWQRVRAVVPANVLIHRLKIIGELDVREWLPKLKIPCLYIQATSDRSVPGSCLSDFTRAVADMRVARIKGPHFILQTQPKACLDALLGFLNAISDYSEKPI